MQGPTILVYFTIAALIAYMVWSTLSAKRQAERHEQLSLLYDFTGKFMDAYNQSVYYARVRLQEPDYKAGGRPKTVFALIGLEPGKSKSTITFEVVTQPEARLWVRIYTHTFDNLYAPGNSAAAVAMAMQFVTAQLDHLVTAEERAAYEKLQTRARKTSIVKK